MSFKCPKCGDSVYRSTSDTAILTAGLVGMLFYGVFSPLECKYCGKILFREFPKRSQIMMIAMSIFMITCALAIIIAAFLYL